MNPVQIAAVLNGTSMAFSSLAFHHVRRVHELRQICDLGWFLGGRFPTYNLLTYRPSAAPGCPVLIRAPTHGPQNDTSPIFVYSQLRRHCSGAVSTVTAKA